MSDIVMEITKEYAGDGAFCNGCQEEGNNYMRLVHTFYCVKVNITNEHGISEIFMCKRCIKNAKKESEKHGMFSVKQTGK